MTVPSLVLDDSNALSSLEELLQQRGVLTSASGCDASASVDCSALTKLSYHLVQYLIALPDTDKIIVTSTLAEKFSRYGINNLLHASLELRS